MTKRESDVDHPSHPSPLLGPSLRRQIKSGTLVFHRFLFSPTLNSCTSYSAFYNRPDRDLKSRVRSTVHHAEMRGITSPSQKTQLCFGTHSIRSTSIMPSQLGTCTSSSFATGQRLQHIRTSRHCLKQQTPCLPHLTPGLDQKHKHASPEHRSNTTGLPHRVRSTA